MNGLAAGVHPRVPITLGYLVSIASAPLTPMARALSPIAPGMAPTDMFLLLLWLILLQGILYLLLS